MECDDVGCEVVDDEIFLGDSLESVLVIAEDDVYVGAHQGNLFHYDGASWSIVTIGSSVSDPIVSDIAQFDDGVILIALQSLSGSTTGGELQLCDDSGVEIMSHFSGNIQYKTISSCILLRRKSF